MCSSTGYDSLPFSIALYDFNKDGRVGFGVTKYGTDSVRLFVGYGNDTFINQTTFISGTNSRRF